MGACNMNTNSPSNSPSNASPDAASGARSDPLAMVDAGDDWLDDMLRDAGREYRADYLADDGFTQRIMGELPEPVTVPAWRRPVVILMWALGLGAVMFSLPGVFEQVFRGAMAVLVGHRLGVPDVAVALLLVGATAWSTLVYAIRSD
jgi:hypothetical protein